MLNKKTYTHTHPHTGSYPRRVSFADRRMSPDQKRAAFFTRYNGSPYLQVPPARRALQVFVRASNPNDRPNPTQPNPTLTPTRTQPATSWPTLL